MNNNDEPTFETKLDTSNLIEWIQASIVDDNNEIVRNFAPDGMRIRTVEESFSEAIVTASAIPEDPGRYMLGVKLCLPTIG